MHSDYDLRQNNHDTATTRSMMIKKNLEANRLILDRSEVAAQPPENPNQVSVDFNQWFYNTERYRP
jgi:hypothetical protein